MIFVLRIFSFDFTCTFNHHKHFIHHFAPIYVSLDDVVVVVVVVVVVFAAAAAAVVVVVVSNKNITCMLFKG